MTFYEGAVLLSLAANAYALYRIGKMEIEIETLYQGLAAVMGDLD
jgi:hypothetical protein